MKTICVLALGLLAVAANAPAQAQESCALNPLATIDMTVTPQRLVLPVRFGEDKRMMALRLGQAANEITDPAARALELPLTAMSDNIHVKRAGGQVAYTARAREFQIGPVKSHNVDFLMLPVTAERGELAGDIGSHIFEKLDFELDMAGGKFLLFSSDHCPGKVVHWTATGFVTVPFETLDMGYLRVQMQLDGKPVMLGLNTAGSSSIGMNAMRRIFGVDQTSPDMTLVETTPDGHKLYRYPFKALLAGGLGIANPAILVRDEPPSDTPCDGKPHAALDKHADAPNKLLIDRTCFGGADGELGLSVLSKLHLYFSKKEKLIYITGAGAK